MALNWSRLNTGTNASEVTCFTANADHLSLVGWLVHPSVKVTQLRLGAKGKLPSLTPAMRVQQKRYEMTVQPSR